MYDSDQSQVGAYDLIIANGCVYDGTGSGGVVTDVGIKDGRIEAVGSLSRHPAERIIDAAGCAVSPGWIDIHTHMDDAIAANPDAKNYLLQGVTTVLGGNCGSGSAGIHVGSWLDNLVGKTWVNVGTLVGHGQIRTAAMENDAREIPTDDESTAMAALTARAMEDGAFGLSSGIEYIPGRYAQKDELVELCKVIAAHGGFYATHSRDEQTGVLNALGESIEVARRAQVRLQYSHMKAAGASVWGYGRVLVGMLNVARAMGVDVRADIYPYGASSTGFSQCLPAWFCAMPCDERKALIERNDSMARSVYSYARNQLRIRISDDPSVIQIDAWAAQTMWQGKRMSEVLEVWYADRGGSTLENCVDFVVRGYVGLSRFSDEQGTVENPSTILYHYISEDDIKTIMMCPVVAIASDGRITESSSAHPRCYGTFPRLFSKYVREEYTLTPSEAIRRVTYLPASQMKLSDRGLLRVGYCADITIFHEDTIADTAEYSDARKYPIGIDYVIVNGSVTVDRGSLSSEPFGAVLRGPGYIGSKE